MTDQCIIHSLHQSSIPDILVRIRTRIWILGSVPLTNGSGSVPKSSVAFRMHKNQFFHIFQCFSK
jgi:hypothetical protein